MGVADLDRMMDAAIAVARQAGALLLWHLERGVVTEFKGDIDLVTVADREAEAMILKSIASQFSDHAFFAEESGESGDSSHVWLVDPLDGTTNFSHGYPNFCVALALQIEERTVLTVIYDPTRDELYTAQQDRGAFLNGRAIHVSSTAKLAKSLLATGFPYDRKTSEHNNLRQHEAFLMRAQGVRRAGSASLDLASVAAGRIDGFWEISLSPWDIVPGAFLVEMAGGKVTDLQGGALRARPSNLVASNDLLHEQMLEVSRTAR